MQDLSGKRVLVLGLGDTGLSMARWLDSRGARVRVADTRNEPPHAARLASEVPGARLDTGGFREASFADAEMLAISPGVPLREPLVAAAAGRGVPVVGDVELFARELRGRAGRGGRVLAITGSNGKSTVTAMSGGMCESAGLDTVVAGNIGLPVLDALSDADGAGRQPDCWVLELSSFQLETTRSLDADAATMLNVSEDHLDRYGSLDEYAAAKSRIFAGGGAQVLNREDGYSRAMALPGRPVHWFGTDAPAAAADWGILGSGAGAWFARGEERLMPVAELPAVGLHNAANALAALALTDVLGLAIAPRLGALRSFRPLPHRAGLVATVGGVACYDDSKGTNVGATVAALRGMHSPVVLIAGGDGKGQDFSPLARPIAEHARAVVLIGRDAGRIADAISGTAVPVVRASSMEEAVRESLRLAVPGDAVLLSPACASYDMFRNYGHRGEVFAAAVRALGAGRA